MEKDIILLVDYNGQFYCPHTGTGITTDLERTGQLFEKSGFRQVIKHFEEIDFREHDFRGKPVLYQSSQDRGLYYKSYIEDIVLGLQLQGALLIPDFYKFRAHHNKLFQEVLRDLGSIGEPAQRLRSYTFSCYESFAKRADSLPYPVVFKASSGDTGRFVGLARSKPEGLRLARRLSRTVMLHDIMDNLKFRLTRKGYRNQSLHRGKIIAQQFVPNLDRDYKIIAMGKRYFVEQRWVRPRDFRASGSRTERTWPVDVPQAVLNYACQVFETCMAPYASIDIMYDGERAYLGEFQFIRFGTKALIRAPHCWEHIGGQWTLVPGRCNWETELVQAITHYLERSVTCTT